MRLFYDEYTSRRRADVLLFLADYAAVISAVLFTSGVCYGTGRLGDALLLALWAVVPRTVARFLSWFERPRDFLHSVVSSALLVLFIVVLVVAGWELLLEAAFTSSPLREVAVLVILLAWGCGFLLCHPRAYLLHDFLLGAMVLVGLLERRPQPYVWLPVFLVALAFSMTVRHLLLDVFSTRRHSPLNLQNARVVAWVTALPAAAVFLLLALAVGPLFDQAGVPGLNRWREGGGTMAHGRRDSRLARHSGDPAREGASASEPRGMSAAVRGYSQQFRLEDLERPLHDERIVLSVRVIAPDGDGRPRPFWRPSGHTLWKGLTFSSFDPISSSWLEETKYERREWDADRTVAANGPPRDAAGAVRLELEVRLPVFTNLIAPYFPVKYGPLASGGKAGHLLENSFGDLFPQPGLTAGSRYFVSIQPRDPLRLLGPPEESGRHPDERYLQLPTEGELGVDLRGLARRVFSGSGSVHAKVHALRRFFERESFRYADEALWWGGQRRLAAFLERERTGNCTYFATAGALLLRAAGVSTRVAVGFSGAVRDDSLGERFVVPNSFAHAWTEVYLPRWGWLAVDPTAWVPPHTGYRPPNEVVRDGTTLRSTRDGEAPGGAGPSPPVAQSAPYRRFGQFAGGVAESGADGAALENAAFSETSPGETTALPWVTVGRPGRDGLATPRPWMSQTEGANRGGERSSVVAHGGLTLGTFGIAVRLALTLLGGVALVLGVVTFLRPRTEEKDDEGEKAQDDSEADGFLAQVPVESATAARDPRSALLWEYHRLQVDLTRTRNHRRPPQTPLEHGRRFAGRHTELDHAFDRLHRLVYTTLYGTRKTVEADVEEVRRSCQLIRRYLG